jgi:hypothetical protein
MNFELFDIGGFEAARFKIFDTQLDPFSVSDFREILIVYLQVRSCSYVNIDDLMS